MTDWLPWGFVFAVTVFLSLGLLLRTLQRTPVGTTPDLAGVWRVLRIGGAATVLVYAVYLVFQERWLWY